MGQAGGNWPCLCRLMKSPEGVPAPADLESPFKRLLGGGLGFGFCSSSKADWGANPGYQGAHIASCAPKEQFWLGGSYSGL